MSFDAAFQLGTRSTPCSLRKLWHVAYGATLSPFYTDQHLSGTFHSRWPLDPPGNSMGPSPMKCCNHAVAVAVASSLEAAGRPRPPPDVHLSASTRCSQCCHDAIRTHLPIMSGFLELCACCNVDQCMHEVS